MDAIHASVLALNDSGVSELPTAEQVIASVPIWRGSGVTVEAAMPGLTNRSFRVRSGGERFVLRLNAAHTPILRVDRANERVALQRAQQAGIGPEVVYSDGENGVLVTRFIDGTVLSADDLERTATLERIAALLREVHALPPFGNGYESLRAAGHYASALPDDAKLQRTGESCLNFIHAQRGMVTASFCHNDVIALNLIDTGSLYLIDWEYAGDNDAFFDLASLIAWHDLDARQTDVLLGAYTGGLREHDKERLEIQRRVYDALHWLWLAARESITPSEFGSRRLAELERGLRLT